MPDRPNLTPEVNFEVVGADQIPENDLPLCRRAWGVSGLSFRVIARAGQRYPSGSSDAEEMETVHPGHVAISVERLKGDTNGVDLFLGLVKSLGSQER